jgi:RNA polymerase sigma factor (sigma-70 family)
MPVHAKTMTSSYSGTVSKPRHLKATALRAYSDQKKKLIEDDRIIELLPMVPKIAKKVISYLKPPLTFEDIIAAGTVGLVKAAKDYDPSHQAEFKTYAYIRIKGSILDELKRWSFLSPEMNRNISAANQQAREFKQKEHRCSSRLTLQMPTHVHCFKISYVTNKAHPKTQSNKPN